MTLYRSLPDFSAFDRSVTAISSCIRFFPLNESNGGAVDLKGNASALTYTGTPKGRCREWPGLFAEGLLLDGVDDCVIGVDDTGINFNSTGNFTILAWIIPDSVTGTLATKAKNTAQLDGWMFATLSNNRLYSIRAQNSSTFVETVGTAGELTPGRPTMVALTYNGSNQRHYINGVLSTTSASDTTSVTASGQVFAIGRQSDAAGLFAKGGVMRVGIFNAALSATTLLGLYKAAYA